MAQYPFQRANPLGYGLFAEMPSADLTKIDENAASGADGSQWTDVAQLVNLPYTFTHANGGRCLAHHPILDTWLTFGVSAGNPVGRSARAPFDTTFALTIDASVGMTPEMVMINPSSGVTVVTGAPGSASKHCIRRSATGGGTYVATDRAGGVTVAGPQTGLFCGGTINKFVTGWGTGLTNGLIETSADGAIWTNVAGLPDVWIRDSMAFSPLLNRLLVVSRESANYLTSTDAVTFTSQTAPAAMSTIYWSSARARFYGIHADAGTGVATFYTSTTGLTGSWSNVGTVVSPAAPFGFNPGPVNGRPIREYGRAMIVGVNLDKIYVSIDGLANLRHVLDVPHTTASVAISSNNQQVMIGATTGVHRAGFRFAF